MAGCNNYKEPNHKETKALKEKEAICLGHNSQDSERTDP